MSRARSAISLALLGCALGCGPRGRVEPSAVSVSAVAGRPVPPGETSLPCAAGADDETLEAADAYGKRVRAVCVHGAPQAMIPDVLAYLRVKPGAIVTEDVLRAEITALFDSGFFRAADVSARPAGSAVDLHFVLAMRPTVLAAELIGAASLAPDHPARSLVKIGSIYDPKLARRWVEDLRALYAAEGFEAASVEHTVAGDGADGVRVRFAVVEGPRNRVGGLTLKGVAKAVEAEVRALPALARGAPISKTSLDDARLEIGERYYQRGYLMVEVRVERGDRAADGSIPLVLEVIDNGQYRAGTVRVTLPEQRREKELLALVQTKPGEPIDPKKLRADGERIAAALRARGWDLALNVETKMDTKKKTVDIDFEAKPPK